MDKVTQSSVTPVVVVLWLTQYAGLNHAIADAGKIVDLLSNQGSRSLHELMDVYEAEMRERGGQEVRLSELNTKMVHDWDALMRSPLVSAGLQANRNMSGGGLSE